MHPSPVPRRSRYMAYEEGNELEYLKPAKPPKGLLGRVLCRIQAEKKLAISRRRTTYFSVALGASVAAFFTASFALQGALFHSEMLHAFSLVFSDPAAVLADWQDFSLFLLEALPVGYLVLFLAALFALLESL